MAALLTLGVLAEIAAWIVGPSRGMYVTAQRGILPKVAAKVNRNGVPISMVVFQLLITTVALIVFTNTGSGGNMSFLIAMALTVVLYLITYFLLFIGYIVLVLKHKDKKRSFQVPGGDGFKILLASVGFLVSVFAFASRSCRRAACPVPRTRAT